MLFFRKKIDINAYEKRFRSFPPNYSVHEAITLFNQSYEAYLAILTYRPGIFEKARVEKLRISILHYALVGLQGALKIGISTASKAVSANKLYIAVVSMQHTVASLQLDHKTKFYEDSASLNKVIKCLMQILYFRVPSSLQLLQLHSACTWIDPSQELPFQTSKDIYQFIKEFFLFVDQLESISVDDSQLGIQDERFFGSLQLLRYPLSVLFREFSLRFKGLQQDTSALLPFFVCHGTRSRFYDAVKILENRFKLQNKTPTFSINRQVYYFTDFFIGNLASLVKEAKERNLKLILFNNTHTLRLEFAPFYNLFLHSKTGDFLSFKEVATIINETWVVTLYYDHPDLFNKVRLRSPLVLVTSVPEEQFAMKMGKSFAKHVYPLFVIKEKQPYDDPDKGIFRCSYVDAVLYLMNDSHGKKIMYQLLGL